MSAPSPYPGSPYGPSPNSMPMRWYRARGPVGALTVLLILVAVANGLLIMAMLGLRATVDDYGEGGTDLQSVEDVVAGVGLAFAVVAGLTIAIFVLTIIWQWRLAKNHQALGRPGTTFGPGWAIGAWFIPLANLVIPILQLAELWKGSAPGLPRGAPHWKRESTAPLLWVWWGLFVASFVLDWSSSIIVDDEASELVEISSELDRVTGLAVMAYGVRIAAAILFIAVIKRLTARQEDAIAEASLGAAIAAPTAYGWTQHQAPGWPPTVQPPAPMTPIAPIAPLAPPGDLAPGWKADPTGWAHHRYWDGVRWTDYASTNGNAFVSPLPR